MSQKLYRVLYGLSYCWTFHHSSGMVLQRSSFLSFVVIAAVMWWRWWRQLMAAKLWSWPTRAPFQLHWLVLSFNAFLVAVSVSFALNIRRTACSSIFMCISTFRPFRCVFYIYRMYCVLLYTCIRIWLDLLWLSALEWKRERERENKGKRKLIQPGTWPFMRSQKSIIWVAFFHILFS